MTPRQVRTLCKPEAQSILKAAMEGLGLSARAHDKVLSVARTIADLEGSEGIKPQRIAEALGYRSLDRSVWMYNYGMEQYAIENRIEASLPFSSDLTRWSQSPRMITIAR